jgi:hypothetical protein
MGKDEKETPRKLFDEIPTSLQFCAILLLNKLPLLKAFD